MFVAGRGDPTPFGEWRGEIGCLLLHGFPGSPAEVREWGAYLSERGISVLAPLLPGHGLRPEALRGVRWQDWLEAAAEGLRRLHERCTWVFAGGLSFGASLALHLAASVPVCGVVAVSPAVSLRNPLSRLIPVAHLVARWIEIGTDDDLADPSGPERQWYYTRVPARSMAEMYHLLRGTLRDARRVTVPVLVVQGRQDGVLRPEGAEKLLKGLASPDKKMLWLDRSGHNALVDIERETIFGETCRFFQRIVDEGMPAA